MGYPPPPGPPPPPGGPGYGPPPGPGYGPPTAPPGGPGHGGPPPGYGGPPPGGPGYGGPPPGYGPAPAGGSGGSSGSNTPLILLVAALVVVAVLVVGGFLVLRSKSGSSDVALTSAQLETALLDAGDLDGDYISEEPSAEGEITSADIDADSECTEIWRDLEDAGAIFVAVTPVNGVEALLYDDTSGVQIDQELSSDGTVGLDRIRDYLDACETFDTDASDFMSTVTFAVVDTISEVGDDRVTFETRVEVEGEDGTFEATTVVWERSGTLGSVTVTQFDPDTGASVSADEGVVQEAAGTADAKLETAIDDAG